MKKLFVLLLSLVTVLACVTSVYAMGSVTYVGGTEKYIFAPGSKESPTDLFDSFKDVMPGDKLTQKIDVVNEEKNNVKVKIYVRSLGADENSVEFLSKLSLTVKLDKETEMFNATSEKTDGMTDWVCLGTLYSGGKATLDLTLDVPADLGDEFQNRMGKIIWEFKTEELPVEKTDPAPQTGDSVYAVFAILAVSATVVVLSVTGIRRKKATQH